VVRWGHAGTGAVVAVGRGVFQVVKVEGIGGSFQVVNCKPGQVQRFGVGEGIGGSV
jgi:hypothetical protein